MVSGVPSPKPPGTKLVGSAGASHPLSQSQRDRGGQGSEMRQGLGCGVLLECGTSTPLSLAGAGEQGGHLPKREFAPPLQELN